MPGHALDTKLLIFRNWERGQRGGALSDPAHGRGCCCRLGAKGYLRSDIVLLMLHDVRPDAGGYIIESSSLNRWSRVS